MRKRFWVPLLLLGIAAIGFFGFAPGMIDAAMNTIDGKPLPKL
jgi:membrane dipeptidase